MNKKTKKDSKLKNVLAKELKSQAEEIDTFIKDTLREIRTQDNLSDYEISYKFSSKPKSRWNKTVAAEIRVDNVYKTANIILRPEIVEMYRSDDKNMIKKILCHEVSHIRIEPLAKLSLDRFSGHKEIGEAIETLTEHYGRLLYHKVNDGKK